MKQATAVKFIEEDGVLLVFPINNRKEPKSLWSRFFPRTRMRWEWNDDGDDKVAGMWRLMKRLSDCRDVVYSKWHQGRATFFSRDVFTAMLCLLRNAGDLRRGLSRDALNILEVLESDSPLSTKEVKRATDLQGRFNETTYSRAMKELFSRQLIVAFGEVDDGSFPSLAVGATRHLYEDLWERSQQMTESEALEIIDRAMPEGSSFRKSFQKVMEKIGPRKGSVPTDSTLF